MVLSKNRIYAVCIAKIFLPGTELKDILHWATKKCLIYPSISPEEFWKDGRLKRTIQFKKIYAFELTTGKVIDKTSMLQEDSEDIRIRANIASCNEGLNEVILHYKSLMGGDRWEIVEYRSLEKLRKLLKLNKAIVVESTPQKDNRVWESMAGGHLSGYKERVRKAFYGETTRNNQ
jgi:hypothetical protein